MCIFEKEEKIKNAVVFYSVLPLHGDVREMLSSALKGLPVISFNMAIGVSPISVMPKCVETIYTFGKVTDTIFLMEVTSSFAMLPNVSISNVYMVDDEGHIVKKSEGTYTY